MPLPDFLAQVGFPRLRRGAKGLAFSRQLRNSPVGSRQDGLKHARCPNVLRIRIPSFTQAALAKTSIRSKNWPKPSFQAFLSHSPLVIYFYQLLFKLYQNNF